MHKTAKRILFPHLNFLSHVVSRS